MASHNENELLRLIAAGDEAAFERLFHAYVPRLHPVIEKVVGSDIAAKDIIQEVFLSLWLDRHKLADIEEPRNWIFRIAYNRAYRYLKRQLVARKANEVLHRRLEDTAPNDTEESLAFAETVKAIRQAVQALPEQARNIYILSREKGIKTSDIAAALNITPQSVKNSLYRSGQFMRGYLAKKGIVVPLVLLTHHFFYFP
ncbi:RNA polymerase sigma factor [Dinghuibacter silviterrae]|uniref:RNA polymerase sigma factor n=1 Tax=Dinghuibacter silviterrae TaxID=1539049 RepID=UPI0013C35D00|nr:RNA polymerase sigma-70 factor [Dinghuibacter silviterrae]